MMKNITKKEREGGNQFPPSRFLFTTIKFLKQFSYNIGLKYTY